MTCRDNITHFPRRIDHNLNVPMTMDYYNRYSRLIGGEFVSGMIFNNPSRFLNGFRRAVNVAGDDYFSQKIEYSIPIIRRGKCVIYTNWLKFGTEPITSVLNSEGISYRVYSGGINKEQRQKLIEDFNDDEFNVLIITKAGGEGIDLKGVKSIIVMEPPWNDASLQQIVGRAIRYKSHSHLPETQRKVDVYFMKLVKPENISARNAVKSGDNVLYEIIREKRQTNDQVNTILRRASI